MFSVDEAAVVEAAVVAGGVGVTVCSGEIGLLVLSSEVLLDDASMLVELLEELTG